MNIYKRYEALSPIYQGGLTNHLPMVLTALKKFGVKDEVIMEKLDQYKDERSLQDLTNKNLGISDFEQEYINLTSKYLGEINHQGEDVVIGTFLNEHKQHIYAALFHGTIRLAYAKQENNPLLIAQALAYFELTIDPIDLKEGKRIYRKDFQEIYPTFVKQFRELDFTFESRGTMNRFKELLEHDLVNENIYQIRDISKEFLLDFVLQGYLETGCFYKLHLITGFEALMELEEYIYDFDEVLKTYFLSAQLFMLFNVELIDYDSDDFELFELENRVEDLHDFHDIKLLFSIIKLSKLFEHKLLKKVANKIFHKITL